MRTILLLVAVLMKLTVIKASAFVPAPVPTFLDEDLQADTLKPFIWTSTLPSNIVFIKASPTQWAEYNGRIFRTLYTEVSVNNAVTVDKLEVVLKRGNLFVKLTNKALLWSFDLKDVSNKAANGKWFKTPIDKVTSRAIEIYGRDDMLTARDCTLDQEEVRSLDPDMSIDDKAKELCPNTCEKQSLIWLGVWNTEDGKKIKSCRCQDPKTLNPDGVIVIDVVPTGLIVDRKTSISTIAKRNCPKTCRALKMTWLGEYSSSGGNEFMSCKCRNL